MKYIFRCYYCLAEITDTKDHIICIKCLKRDSICIKSDFADYVFYYNIFNQKYYLKTIEKNTSIMLLEIDNSLTFKELISYLDNLIFI
jgi:hypothetical protein